MSSSFSHPLGQMSSKSSTSLDMVEQLQVPSVPNAVTSWNLVDEAVHRAFTDGSVLEEGLTLNLSDLVSTTPSLVHVILPDGDFVHKEPPVPCRGLARLECLVPRPFPSVFQEDSKDSGSGGN